MVKRQLTFSIPLVFGASLLFAAWYLRRHEQSHFAAPIFVSLGILITGLAIVYFCSAGQLAVMLEQRSANKHPIYRLWLPARFISAKAYFWQLRAVGVIGTLLGFEFVALGVLFYMHHH